MFEENKKAVERVGERGQRYEGADTHAVLGSVRGFYSVS